MESTHNTQDAAFQMHLEQAYTYEEQDALEDALRECDAALALKPTNPDAHNLRGIVLEGLGRPLEAIAAYEQALRLDEAFMEAEENLAAVQRDIEREDRSAQPPTSFFTLAQDILLHPSIQTFKYYLPEAHTGRAMRWYIFMLVAGMFVGLFNIVLQMMWLDGLPVMEGELGGFTVESLGMLAIMITVFFILGILLSVVMLYVIAGIFHMFARLLGGKGRFNEMLYMITILLSTFYTVSILLSVVFSVGSVIPVLGIVVQIVGAGLSIALALYSFLLQAMAIAAVHDFTLGKGVVVILLPLMLVFVLMCGCVALTSLTSLTSFSTP